MSHSCIFRSWFDRLRWLLDFAVAVYCNSCHFRHVYFELGSFLLNDRCWRSDVNLGRRLDVANAWSIGHLLRVDSDDRFDHRSYDWIDIDFDLGSWKADFWNRELGSRCDFWRFCRELDVI